MDTKPAGRPTIFSEQLAANFLEQVATTSFSLRTICNDELMPSVSTIFRWINENEAFKEQYARAREAKADLLAEEILEISDDGSNDLMTIVKGDQSYEMENKEVVNRSKLRVDSRKWLASKMMPRKYGDKIQTEHSGEINLTQITGMKVV